jgi:hypothetical protein
MRIGALKMTDVCSLSTAGYRYLALVHYAVLNSINVLNFMHWYPHNRRSGFPAALQAAYASYPWFRNFRWCAAPGTGQTGTSMPTMGADSQNEEAVRANRLVAGAIQPEALHPRLVMGL